MADNRITIQAEFGQSYKDLGFVGRVGENDSREIAFDCADVLTQFPGASIVCVIKRACDTKPYSAPLTEDGYSRILPLSAAENAVAGQIMIELRAVSDDTILKSAMFSGRIAESLQGEGDRPGNPVRDVLDRVDSTLQSATETQKKLLSALDGVDTAVDGANTAAENAQTIADKVQAKLDNGDFVGPAGKDGANGKDGAPGKDGKDGEKGPKGEPGDPGSDASVTADNIKAALGYTPVKDVQMDGESLVQDSVATIPLAGYNRLGAIQLDPAGFAAASIEGKLALVPPTDAQISTHTHTQRPITPSCMDYAVKAAMCDGKGAAWTANEQKAARERLGVPGEFELIEEITLSEDVMNLARDAFPDGTPYDLRSLIIVVDSTNVANALSVDGWVRLNTKLPANEWAYIAPGTFISASRPLSFFVYRALSDGSSDSYFESVANTLPTGYASEGRTHVPRNLIRFGFHIHDFLLYSTGEAMPANTRISIYGVRA